MQENEKKLKELARIASRNAAYNNSLAAIFRMLSEKNIDDETLNMLIEKMDSSFKQTVDIYYEILGTLTERHSKIYKKD